MNDPAPAIPRSLFVFAIFYGGMVPLGGFLGAKQIAVSSGVAQLHGKAVANRLVAYGFVPLLVAIALAFLVLQLPTDPGMYPPAIEAFPIIVGQSGRMMAAGVLAYGVSVSLNVWIFSRLADANARFAEVRGIVAATLSQIVDTLIFITVSFYGVRPIMDLMLGQMLAKIVLSIVVVPLVIALVVRIGRKLDEAA
jgi:queuosine precursor transporter